MDLTHRRPASDSSPAAEGQQGPTLGWDVHGTYQDGALLTPEEHAVWRRSWGTEPPAVAEGWDMDQERRRWARRQGNDWPVPADAVAVLDAHAARGAVIGDRTLRVAVTLWVQRLPWEKITELTGVSRKTLEARRAWPEFAEMLVDASERILARTGLLEGPALAYNAARAAVGMRADLGPGLPRDVDLLPSLPHLAGDVPGGEEFTDRFVYDGKPWRALEGHAAVARERQAAQRRIAARYGRKPLAGARLRLVAPSLRRQARLHGRSIEVEFSEQIETAQWFALWSVSAGQLMRRTQRELHSAIAREVTEGLLGPDPDRKRAHREKLDALVRAARHRAAALRTAGYTRQAARLDVLVEDTRALLCIPVRERTSAVRARLRELRALLEAATGTGHLPPLEQALEPSLEQVLPDLQALEAAGTLAEPECDVVAACRALASPGTRGRELLEAHLSLLEHNPKATVSDAARAVGMKPTTAHTHYKRLRAKVLDLLKVTALAV